MARNKALSVAIVGAGMIRFGELFDHSYDDMLVGAYRACLKSVDKGIDENDLEAAWLGTCIGSLVRHEAVTGGMLAEPLRFYPRPITRVENACCTGSDAIRNAAFAIQAGVYDTVLVIGCEKMRDVPSRDSLMQSTAVVFHQWWSPRGASAPSRFGQFATAHFHAFGTSRRHMAMIAQKNHKFGSMNPHAFFQKEVSLDDVLNSPMVSWPVSLMDCCPTTDGAAAVILTRADRAYEYSNHPIYYYGGGLATDPFIAPWKSSFIGHPATVAAAKDAYEMAGITAKDVSLAEVHDCFTCNELITYEDLGFCEKGKAGAWIEEGGPELGGQTPVNTSGGLKAKGHPIGATGVAQAVEMWEQFRGEAGARQVKDAKIGITHNMGGIGTIVLINVYGNEPR